MRAPNELPAVQAFHREWNGGAPIVDVAEKHRFTEAFVARVLAPKDPRWGRKSRAAGAGPISKDTVAYWLGPVIPTKPTDGLVDARDLLTSAGADSWNRDDDPGYNNILATWYPVVPAREVATSAVALAQETGAADVPTGDELAAIEGRLREHIDAALAQVRTDLRAVLDGLPAAVAGAVHESLKTELSEVQATIGSALAGVPREYDLRYLGRVVGTLTPR